MIMKALGHKQDDELTSEPPQKTMCTWKDDDTDVRQSPLLELTRHRRLTSLFMIKSISVAPHCD